MTSHIKFIFRLFILVVIALPLNYYINIELLGEDFGGIHYFSYTYFIIVVFIVHLILNKALKERPQRYVVAFMASMGAKIFLSLMILVVIMYTGIEKSKTFAINYLMLYLIFSAFSVNNMLKSLKDLPKEE